MVAPRQRLYAKKYLTFDSEILFGNTIVLVTGRLKLETFYNYMLTFLVKIKSAPSEMSSFLDVTIVFLDAMRSC